MVDILYNKDGQAFVGLDTDYWHTLVYATSGYGKTILIESIVQAWKEREKKGIVIDLTDAKGAAEATDKLYAPDPNNPNEAYQCDALAQQGEKPTRHENVKMYELVSPALIQHHPNDITPPVHYFTISIKDITRDLLSFLLETGEQPALANVIIKKITTLSPSNDLFDLVKSLKNITREDTQPRQDAFFMDGITASFESVKNIILRLSPLADTPIIMQDNCPTNLHLHKLLKDWRNYHIFLNRYNTDDKMRDLHACWLLSKLLTLTKEDIPYPVLIIIDELRIFSPQDKTQAYYKIALQDILAKLLSIGRSKGITILTTTQMLSGIDKKISRAFSTVALGKLPDLEIDTAASIMRLEKEDMLFINNPGTKHGTFTIAKNPDITDAGGFQTRMPRHYHANKDFNAYARYHKTYPEKESANAERLAPLLTFWEKRLTKHTPEPPAEKPPKTKKGKKQTPTPPITAPTETPSNVTALADALKNLKGDDTQS